MQLIVRTIEKNTKYYHMSNIYVESSSSITLCTTPKTTCLDTLVAVTYGPLIGAFI